MWYTAEKNLEFCGEFRYIVVFVGPQPLVLVIKVHQLMTFEYLFRLICQKSVLNSLVKVNFVIVVSHVFMIKIYISFMVEFMYRKVVGCVGVGRTWCTYDSYNMFWIMLKAVWCWFWQTNDFAFACVTLYTMTRVCLTVGFCFWKFELFYLWLDIGSKACLWT